MTILGKRPSDKVVGHAVEEQAAIERKKVAYQKKEPTWDSSTSRNEVAERNGCATGDNHALQSLFSASAEAKIWGIALKGLNKPTPPLFYPEYTEPGSTEYVYRELDFWTSGFFPGSLYLLLERRRKYSHELLAQHKPQEQSQPHELQLNFACQWWAENLHQNAVLESTHDLGFMIGCWAQLAWDLNHDFRALETMRTAAKTLDSRFSTVVGCIRSWDTCITRKYSFQDPNEDYLTIIDNMMNLDLLFKVASITGERTLFDHALQHAKTTQREHVAPDSSTRHLVVFDPHTGHVKSKLTNQGYANDSCWSRGQAWAITGFAQTYHWTHDESFLTTARNCADYFLERLPSSSVPPWDFDAPSDQTQPTDTSAGLIAAYGMLLIHEALTAAGQESKYLKAALQIAQAVCRNHLNPPAHFTLRNVTIKTVEHGQLEEAVRDVDIGHGESILNGATINNYEFAPRRWANHGLVYADYYFLLLGNKLLELGVGALILQSSAERTSA